MGKTLSSKIIFNGKALKLRIDTVSTDGGRETTREIIEHPDCIAVIAIDSSDNIILVQQYRDSIGKELLEIPAGGIEVGETPEKAVIREMREETGFRPTDVKHIGGFYSSPGFCTEYLYLFVVKDLIRSPLVAEDTQTIKLIKVSYDQIPELIMSGKVCDSKSIAGLLHYFCFYINKKKTS